MSKATVEAVDPKTVDVNPPTKEEMELKAKKQANTWTNGLLEASQITKENAEQVKKMLESLRSAIKFVGEVSRLVKETGFVYLPFTRTLSQRTGEVGTVLELMVLENAKEQLTTAGMASHFEQLLQKGVADAPFANKLIEELEAVVAEKLEPAQEGVVEKA
jgi:hypothetical protein